MIRKNIFLFGLIIILSLPAIHTASAQFIGNWDFLNGIVPCGRCAQFGTDQNGKVVCLVPSPGATSAQAAPCTVCHFYKLLQNIINFLLFTSSALITLAAIYIGFLFLFSGGSPPKITDAKSKLWLLMWGIFWVLGSWLVLNTVINFITVIGTSKEFPLPWNQISCEVSQSQGGQNVNTGPFPNSANSSITLSESPFNVGSDWSALSPLALQRLDSGVYKDGVDTSTFGYQQLNEEIDGLKLIDPADPYAAADPINPAVDQQVSQVNTGNVVNPNLVKSIVQAESGGNPNAVHLDKDGQSSYGLMQVRPDTAKNYDSSLMGLTDSQIGQKLEDPNYNMKIGTAYLQDLAAKYSGDLDKVIAAYNGGPGANGSSVDCPGSTRWQCGWDNQAHTIPNTGYQVTRDYVTKVKQYYSQINQ